MSGFLLRPLDWVSFGPPRPHAAGEAHHRETDVPPTPTSFQGIVRTALLRAAGLDLIDRSPSAQGARDALVGTPERLPKGWQLRGPFLTSVEERIARPWVKVPRFLLEAQEEHDPPVRARRLHSPRVEDGPAALNDLSPKEDPVLLGDPGAKDPLEGWLSPRGLRWALSGATTGWDGGKDHCRRLPPFVKRDLLPGLAIDSTTGTAEDGMLYFGQVLRFQGLSGMAGWLSGSLPSAIPADALTRGGMAACGWKSRPGVLEDLPALDPDWLHVTEGRHLPKEVAEGDTFFLTALTPIPCSQGATVEAVERDLQEHGGLPIGVKIRVLAMLTGKPRVIGGIETASRRTRPNRSYWEAGSAFLFTFSEGSSADRAEALQRLNDAHPLGSRAEASFGYGHTLVAVGDVKEGRA